MIKKARLRVALFCDRRDWILGTWAEQIRKNLEPTGLFEFYISSTEDFLHSPLKQLRLFSTYDLIHWISGLGYHYLGTIFHHKPQLCTIHHCLERDNEYPQHYAGIQVLTVSRNTLEQLVSRGFEQVRVVYNGVDPQVFKPLPQNWCRHQLGIQTIRPLIGFFAKESSNPDDRKGTKTLLKALEIVNAKNPITLLIAGEGWLELKQTLEAKGVEVFHRKVSSLPDMPKLYGALDLYLCASRIEGGPATLLEAMACERLVVSTPVGHAPEVIRDKENGLLIPIDDSDNIAKIILQILADKNLAFRIAKAARISILESWTWEKTLKPLVDIYQKAALSGGIKKRYLSRYIKEYSIFFTYSLYHRIRRKNCLLIR